MVNWTPWRAGTVERSTLFACAKAGGSGEDRQDHRDSFTSPKRQRRMETE